MISKEIIKKYSNNVWSSGIFTIPNDLYYSEISNTLFQNDYDKNLLENEIVKKSFVEKTIFTNLLTPNWKKHINNYVRHKLSGYRKKIRNFNKLYLEK
jgi:hypothetical protein